MVIQFAKFPFVLSTASRQNHSLVKSYGADIVVNHHSLDATAKLITIASEEGHALDFQSWCVDNVSLPRTGKCCAKVLAPNSSSGAEATSKDAAQEKLYSVLTPQTPEMPGIKTVRTLGYSFRREEYEFMGQRMPASREDFESARRFAVVVEQLLKHQMIRPHPVDVRETGLEGVVNEGLAELKSGKLSGKKLVYLL